MSDTEFNMLCNLLGIPSEVNQPSGVQPSGAQTVPVTGKPSVMYPVNQPSGVQSQAPIPAGNVNNGGKWHNFPVTSDPNFDSEKSYGHIFQVNGAYYVFFIPKSLVKMYNNVLSFGIQENKFYTIYAITDYQNKQKSKCPEISGKDLAVMLGI